MAHAHPSYASPLTAPSLRVVHRPPLPSLSEPGFPYGEELLQFLWSARLFNTHGLRTTDGRSVEVVRPGRIQHNSGPDLEDAQVRIDGQLWAGSVEVHLRSSDWYAHGHQHDPAYDNVVLHVVHDDDMPVHSRQGHALPTVELVHRIATDSIALHLELMRARDTVPCGRQLHAVDPLRRGQWLERVLVERLQRRTTAVVELHHQLGNDPSATLYHMVARAFGLKVNAEAFGMLAHALPLRVLLKYRDDLFRTEALLFGQAGLLQVDMVEDHPRALQREHAHMAHLHGLVPAPLAAWKFGRMRPMNFPTVRIAQLAQLIVTCDGDLGALLEMDDVNALRARLMVTAGGYWDTHYAFDRPGPHLPKRLGGTAADHIIINAVVPVLFAFGRLHGREAYQDRALHLLDQLPPERNHLLARWAAWGVPADTAGRGQALLELGAQYCAARRCLSCGIGDQLMRRSVKRAP